MPEQVLYLAISPFVIRLQSSIPSVLDSVKYFYQDCQQQVVGEESFYFADFHIRIAKVINYRYWYRSQVQFYFDGSTPFKPLPYSQAYPFFEWGINWCISNHTYQYLLLHSAVVEKNGIALVLPGQPGAGKSTLCAALMCDGWRLLSDEMAVIDMGSKELIPIVRPINLKNESIPLIKQFSPDVEFGETFFDTGKGAVAHMKPSVESIKQSKNRVSPSRFVFPLYQPSSSASLHNLTKGQALLRLAENSFNYNVLANQGFETLCDLVLQCQCEEFIYSDVEEAVALFSSMCLA